MFVGEAPGHNEDRVGLPFVGDVGAVLNRCLGQAGLERAAVFITNAVRCRPPENRKPRAKEIAACKHHLIREIDAIRPTLIITLGNASLKSITGLSGIKKYRGNVQEMHKSMGEHRCPVLPTLHPAYALRYPEHENEIIQDIVTGLRQLDGGFREIETPYVFFCDGYRPNVGALCSFDIETNAREMHDPELAVWFGSIDDGTNIIMYVGEDEMIEYVTALEKCAVAGTLVGHNSSNYDRTVLLEKYGVPIKCDDTQLLAHLIDEQQPLKLQDLAVKYLGIAPWKDGFDVAFWRRGPKSVEEWVSAILYNARDTRYTRLLFEELWSRATPAEQNLYRRHNLPCSRALRTTERHGVYLSVPNIEKGIAEIEVDQRIALLRVKEMTNADFNPGSHQQVREVLFSDMLLPVQKKTKGQEASTDEETLKRLQAMGLGGDLLKTILDYRENSKLLGTYLRPYLELANTSLQPPMMYPRYSMTSTVTGRTSCFNPNLQNVPRDKRVRSCVAAPPGYVLVEADYSQLELRMAAELAGPQCPLFQEYLRPNPDVHLTMAERLTGKPRDQITEEERSRAKPPNFAYLYLAEWATYQRISLTDYDIIVSENDARRAQMAFKAWGLDPWYSAIEAELRATGEVVSLFGRRRRLPAFRSNDKYARLEALREGVNFSDQSPASDLTLLALAQIVGRGFWTCGYIHDSIQALVPDTPEAIAHATAWMKFDMEVTTPQLVKELFGYAFRIPLVADVKAGPHWGYKAPKTLDSVGVAL
jgi:uracil-DNA glycosylase family 4